MPSSTLVIRDTSGRSFSDVYAKQASTSDSQKIQQRTEQMILQGITGRATDILIDPRNEAEYAIRFRVDGFLRVHEVLDSNHCNAVINSLKAISGMDIAEKRRPQDGAFMARMPEGDVFFQLGNPQAE